MLHADIFLTTTFRKHIRLKIKLNYTTAALVIMNERPLDKWPSFFKFARWKKERVLKIKIELEYIFKQIGKCVVALIWILNETKLQKS